MIQYSLRHDLHMHVGSSSRPTGMSKTSTTIAVYCDRENDSDTAMHVSTACLLGRLRVWEVGNSSVHEALHGSTDLNYFTTDR